MIVIFCPSETRYLRFSSWFQRSTSSTDDQNFSDQTLLADGTV